MEYMLLIHADPAVVAAMSPAQMSEMVVAHGAYAEVLRKAGALRASARLRPADTATTVRVSSGKTEVLNGPYAETREQLGGYYLIDAPDLDAAIDWAARCPSVGSVEVRPVWPVSEY